MNYSDYELAGGGLKLMFWGEIVTIAAVPAAVLSAILGVICVLAGGIMCLVGLSKAGAAHQNFRSAMVMTVAGMVLSVLGNMFSRGFLGGIVTIAASVVSFLVTYYVCTASGMLLESKGDLAQADRAALIWKLFGGCTAVSVLCILVGWIPLLNLLAAVPAVIAGVVSLVASVLYLIFLYRAYQSLLT